MAHQKYHGPSIHALNISLSMQKSSDPSPTHLASLIIDNMLIDCMFLSCRVRVF